MFHMEQKDYKLEIVLSLLKENCHARALAKILNTNHTTILRKLKELLRENVLDFKEEGKNKIYFLKKTSESKANVFMAEQYKLTRTLKKYSFLRILIDKIQVNKKISLAILFGSYSKGIAKKNSDIDVYIETTNKKIKQDLESLNSKLNIKIGKYNKDNLLVKEIEKNHVIMKGVELFYERNKFFETA